MNEFYSARELYKNSGYARWENFENLVKRAENLIKNGVKKGIIEHSKKGIKLGGDAIRQVKDYTLDNMAYNLINELSCSYKLNNCYIFRNETSCLLMVKKFFENKKIPCCFQKRIGCFVFDMMIDNRIAIEFNEPHHEQHRQFVLDRNKISYCNLNNIQIRSYDLSNDAIDIILDVQEILDKS
jgi:hypothetical protein